MLGSAAAGLRGCGALEDSLTEAAVNIENIAQGQSNPLLRSRVGKLTVFARVAMWLGAAGGRPAVVRMMRQNLAANLHPGAAVQRAVLAAEAGDFDDAIDNLDRAIAFRDPCLVYLAIAPQWDALRGDPRFADRVRRMKLPVGAPLGSA